MSAPGAFRAVRRAVLPLAVFVAVVAVHFVILGLFPDRDPAQEGWMPVPGADAASWSQRYFRAGAYWTGYTYGLSLAFTVVAFRLYRERRLCTARTAAIGGLTLSGFLAVAGCFLVGCCGSPMLGVYLSLFGAGFLPFAKPLVAAITTLMIAGCYVWMRRRARRTVDPERAGPCCQDPACNDAGPHHRDAPRCC